MKTVYLNGKILTGILKDDRMKIAEGALVVENEKIVSVGKCTGDGMFSRNDAPKGSATRKEQTRNCKVVDLGGRYVLPGLINMHVHIASKGGPDKPSSKPIDYKKLFETLSKHPLVLSVFKRMQESTARDLLFSGVTTARTVGGVMDFDGKIRDRINAGKAVGPRLLVCNTAVSVPGGHFAGSLATEAKTPEEAREHVRKIVATGPDWIKIMITGGAMDAVKIGEPGILKMSPEITAAACDEAHKLGYKVCAHVEGTEGVRVALESGVDSIEHGARMGSELIELFKKNGTMGVCTFSPAVTLAKCDHLGSEAGTVNSKALLEGFTAFGKACLENGIPLGLGTDSGCPYVTAYNTWHELVWWTEALEVTTDFVLYAATLNNARLLGIDKITGSLEPGKEADFIVVDENPLENLETLKDVRMVCAKGKLYKHPKIRKNPKVEAIWPEIRKLRQEPRILF